MTRTTEAGSRLTPAARSVRAEPVANLPDVMQAAQATRLKVADFSDRGLMMNVKELKALLGQYPDDMEIVNGRCSDYQIISADEWSTVQGVAKNGWVMRSHPTMSDENKRNEKTYLYLEGN